VRFAALAALIAVLVVAGLQLAGLVEADATTLALLGLGVALLFPLLWPAQVKSALRRVTKLSVGGIDIGFAEGERAERVDRRLPALEDDVKVESRPETGHPAGDVLRVRDMAKRRLRFIRDRLPVRKYVPDYSDVIDHLQNEDLLDEDEARLLYAVLADDIASWGEDARVKFLDAAWPLSYRLAALVWDRMVRARLFADGWYIADFPQGRRHRADFRITYGEGERYVGAARVATGEDAHVRKSRRRLSESAREGERAVVIVPEKNDYEDDGQWPDVEVVSLEEFVRRRGAVAG
jgi:hypothetical protein